jgi:hypothetical protein
VERIVDLGVAPADNVADARKPSGVSMSARADVWTDALALLRG